MIFMTDLDPRIIEIVENVAEEANLNNLHYLLVNDAIRAGVALGRKLERERLQATISRTQGKENGFTSRNS